MRRILVVDDFEPWRQTVRGIIATQPELQIIAEAADGEEAVSLAAALKPDLVVLDIGLPRLNGLDAAARIFEVSPQSKALFLSLQNDPATIQAVLDLGASAYVHKLNVRSQLLSAITTALDTVATAAL